jgi:hypothetical protein
LARAARGLLAMELAGLERVTSCTRRVLLDPPGSVHRSSR